MKMTRRHFSMALALSIVFGVGWVFGKTATTHFSPIFVAMLRFGIAGIAIVTVCGWPKVQVGHLLFASACAISIPYSLSYIGLSRLDVSVTVLLVQLEAPILIVLSAIWLREIPSRRSAVGVAMAVGGVLFVAGQPSTEGHAAGIAIVIVSMVCWLSLKTDPVLSPRFDPLSRYALLVMMWSMLVSPFVSVSPFRSWL